MKIIITKTQLGSLLEGKMKDIYIQDNPYPHQNDKLDDEYFYDKQKNEKPTITFLIGPPASGKSTWVQQNAGDSIIISRDDIVDELRKPLGISYGDTFKDKDFQSEVNQKLKEHINNTLNSGEDIVVDMTNMNKKSRSNILSKVPENYTKNAVVFKVNRDELIKRLNKRKEETGKEVGINIVDDMISRFEMPDNNEFDNIEIFK